MSISSGISVATIAAGSTNTKGSYAQFYASTATRMCGVMVAVNILNGATCSATWDIATGAGGSEVIKVADVHNSNSNYWAQNRWGHTFPLGIPASTRIAVRTQCTVASRECDLVLHLIPGANDNTDTEFCGSISSSLPAAIDSGGVLNTFGSYLQLKASTSIKRDWAFILMNDRVKPAFDPSATFNIQFATGAGGSEVVRVQTDPMMGGGNSTNSHLEAASAAMPLYVLASTRVAARCKNNNTTNATYRLMSATMHLCNMPDSWDFTIKAETRADTHDNSGPVVSTSSASANVYGSWAQMIASSSQKCSGFHYLGGDVSDDSAKWIDVGTGAGGSEVVCVNKMGVSQNNPSMSAGLSHFFLAGFNASTRFAARNTRNNNFGQSMVQAISLVYGENRNSNVYTYSGGSLSVLTTVDPGGVANTKGSYVQQTASCTEKINWLINNNQQHASTSTAAEYRLDIATGAGGSEVVQVADLYMRKDTSFNDQPAPLSYTIPLGTNIINASTRLAVRASSGTTDANTRTMNESLYATFATFPSGPGQGANPGKGGNKGGTGTVGAFGPDLVKQWSTVVVFGGN